MYIYIYIYIIHWRNNGYVRVCVCVYIYIYIRAFIGANYYVNGYVRIYIYIYMFSFLKTNCKYLFIDFSICITLVICYVYLMSHIWWYVTPLPLRASTYFSVCYGILWTDMMMGWNRNLISLREIAKSSSDGFCDLVRSSIRFTRRSERNLWCYFSNACFGTPPPQKKTQRDTNEIKGGITRRNVTVVLFAAHIRSVSALVPRIIAISLTKFLGAYV